MPSNTSGEPAKLRFRCSTCGEDNVRSLDWAVAHDNLPCDSCGGLIDLTSEESRFIIDRADEAAHRLRGT